MNLFDALSRLCRNILRPLAAIACALALMTAAQVGAADIGRHGDAAPATASASLAADGCAATSSDDDGAAKGKAAGHCAACCTHHGASQPLAEAFVHVAHAAPVKLRFADAAAPPSVQAERLPDPPRA